MLHLACHVNYLHYNCDQYNQAYWLFSFSEKIKGFCWMWNIYAKTNRCRGATSFNSGAHIVQSIYKWYAPNIWCLSKSLCWWHLYIWDRPQRGVQSQKAAVRSQCYWDLVWALEHKIIEDKTHAIYFSHRLRLHEAYLTLNGRNIPFVNHVKLSRHNVQ
jgi:hypothetical protein